MAANEVSWLDQIDSCLKAEIEATLAEGGTIELSDANLEMIAAGKSGGGGGGRRRRGGGGNSVQRGFANLAAFQNFQARTFRNSGVRVGSRREGRYIP